MKTLLLVFAWLIAAASAALSPAAALQSSIGVYFDPAGATCSAQVELGVPFTIYLNAILGPDPTAGVVRAEFHLRGLPAEWWILETTVPPAATAVIGSATLGCHIFFEGCPGTGDPSVTLLALRVLPVTVLSNVHLRVGGTMQPCDNCNCFTDVPRLVRCDGSFWGPWGLDCVAGGEAWINGPACTVGAAPATWGGVKQLYE
jgi:hypothetical protein